MISRDQLGTLHGKTMVASSGEKLGTVDTLYADREAGEPTFATVHTGLFGGRSSFVPLQEAELSGDDVRVPYTKDQVKDAPHVDPDAELSPEEEDRLYAHYGLTGSGSGTQTGTGTGGETGTETGAATGTGEGFTSRGEGHDVSGPNTDDAMTRSEERLQVGTQQVETGRARLRKYVTTETETVQVPVTKERVTLEREPVTEANAGQAYDGPAISEEEHEVVLHEEKPVIAKEAVPVERVRLGTETVQEQQTVSEEVRKEQIDADGVYPEGQSQGTQQEQRQV